MVLEQAIMEILKKYSSSSKETTTETRPLKCTEITKYLQKEFPDEHRASPVTEKRVRSAINRILNSELPKDDKDKSIRYTTYKRGDKDYRTDFWTPCNISDLELKYLVDSVMYSKIFDSATAQDFAGRIQQMSGRNLYRMTAYVDGNSFGKQRLTINVNVLQNLQKIMDAEKKDAFLSFDFNVYDVVGNRIGLKKKDNYTVKPIHIILNDGRYFMLARYKDSHKVYTFSIDLMSQIVIQTEIKDKVIDTELERNFNRAQYLLQHPYNMGGKVEHIKLRIKREYLSRAVDTFGYEMQIIPRTLTETTVDVRVRASLEGIKRWLLAHYDAAVVINPSDELKKVLSEAANILWKQYKSDM